MQTEAVFENIAKRITSEIKKAEHSIYIAVAWFTNRNLFDELLLKSQEGCSVSLMISDDAINNKGYLDFTLLEKFNGKCFKIGNGETDLMHNKFCVIDYSTVITGSYNWSYKAETNLENIVIHENDTVLAKQFVNEFNKITNRFYGEVIQPEVDDFPLDKIIKRLEILKNFILLEEHDDIKQTAKKLHKYSFNEDIKKILYHLRADKFSNAMEEIQLFLSSRLQLITWDDPEIAVLKLEIRNLENQINAFENEKAEMEKILFEFNHRHALELGEIILNILKLRKKKYKYLNKEKSKEANEDYKEYKKQFNSQIETNVFDLSQEDKVLLKKKYKSASILCHPDKFTNEPADVQKQAQELFKELNNANSTNDLERVSEILENLKAGILTVSKRKSLTDKTKLRKVINQLTKKFNKLKEEVDQLRESETYSTIIKILNWDLYFKENKELLQKELEELENG